jgi:hypothetical protein
VTDNMSQYPSTRRAGYASDSGGWWAGAGLFAALTMILVGIWQAMVGLIALVQNDFYVATRDYPFKFDATTGAGSTCWAVSYRPHRNGRASAIGERTRTQPIADSSATS